MTGCFTPPLAKRAVGPAGVPVASITEAPYPLAAESTTKNICVDSILGSPAVGAGEVVVMGSSHGRAARLPTNSPRCGGRDPTNNTSPCPMRGTCARWLDPVLGPQVPFYLHVCGTDGFERRIVAVETAEV